jgi:hypothetical protein
MGNKSHASMRAWGSGDEEFIFATVFGAVNRDLSPDA